MKWTIIICALLSLISLSSCIEIIDDLSINDDGSGTFKYTVNLSSSKVKVNSILALDSLDGKKVPSIEDIAADIETVISQLKVQDGISNVQMESNFDDFIFKLQCDFKSVDKLQEAIKEIIRIQSKREKIEELESDWITFSDNKLIRSIPNITVEKAKQLKTEDAEALKLGSYTSITRFESEIESVENPEAKLAKNNKAVMLRTSTYKMTVNSGLLDNTIYLVKAQ